MKKMKGAFSLNNLLVGTVWPPELNQGMPLQNTMRETSCVKPALFFEEGRRPTLPKQGLARGLYWGPPAASLQDPFLYFTTNMAFDTPFVRPAAALGP